MNQNDELDRCLEFAIISNAITFVELLFEYGASLQRLALISDSEVFKIKVMQQRYEFMKLFKFIISFRFSLNDDVRNCCMQQ